MKTKVLSVIATFLIIAIGVVQPINVFAAGEEGTGTGTGTGSSDPLAVVSATIQDGQKDVSPSQEITFVFSKNVANLTVKENNEKSFTVTDHSGKPVGFTVLIADDQLEREKRNDINIIIDGGLKAGEDYTIAISKNIMAKNGESLDQDYTYGFTVAGAAEEQGTSSLVGETVSLETSKTVSPGMNSVSVILLATLGLLAILSVLFIVLKKKNGGKHDSNREEK